MVDKDPEDVLSIGDSVEEEDISQLRELLHKGGNPTMRVQAANVLGDIGSTVGEATRENIVDDLITTVLKDDHDEVRATAIETLYFLDTDNIDTLVEVAAEQVKYSQSGTDVTEFFQSWLQSSVSEFRLVGAAGMERFGDESVAATLEETFTDSDPRVRAWAVSAYGRLGSEATADPIEPLLEDSRSMVRQAAARALGKIASDTAFDLLVSATRADDEPLREAAVEQLVGFDHSESVVALIRSLPDSSPGVRYKTALSLLSMLSTSDRIDTASVPDQISAEVDPSSLDTLADTFFEVARDGNDDGVDRPIRLHAVWLLGELSRTDSDTSRLLVQLLRTDEKSVVDLAAAYLKLLDGETLERELQTLISDSTVSPPVRTTAKTVLRRVKRNGAAVIVDQGIEYTYVQSPRDYTDKHVD